MGMLSFKKNDKKKDAGKTKPVDEGGAKKSDAGSTTVVLKLDLHCDGCAKKVTKSIRHFEGTNFIKFESLNFVRGIICLFDYSWCDCRC